MECISSNKLDLAETEISERQNFDKPSQNDEFVEQNNTVFHSEHDTIVENIETAVVADQYSETNFKCNEMVDKSIIIPQDDFYSDYEFIQNFDKRNNGSVVECKNCGVNLCQDQIQMRSHL